MTLATLLPWALAVVFAWLWLRRRSLSIHALVENERLGAALRKTEKAGNDEALLLHCMGSVDRPFALQRRADGGWTASAYADSPVFGPGAVEGTSYDSPNHALIALRRAIADAEGLRLGGDGGGGR